MSMDLAFAVLPDEFKTDGNESELHQGDPTDDVYKDGVLILETEGEEMIPSPLGLSLNENGVGNVNRETEGAFLELTGGDTEERYVMLAGKLDALNRIRMAIHKISDPFRYSFLVVLMRNADAALEKYGDRAALIVE